MGRALNTYGTELGLIEAFDQVEIALNQEAVSLAGLMLEERRQRVKAYSDQLGSLLGMNPVLDSWMEITSTDPAILLN